MVMRLQGAGPNERLLGGSLRKIEIILDKLKVNELKKNLISFISPNQNRMPFIFGSHPRAYVEMMMCSDMKHHSTEHIK